MRNGKKRSTKQLNRGGAFLCRNVFDFSSFCVCLCDVPLFSFVVQLHEDIVEICECENLAIPHIIYSSFTDWIDT